MSLESFENRAEKITSFILSKTGLIFFGLFVSIIIFLFLFLEWKTMSFSSEIDSSNFSDFGGFIGGVLGTILSFLTFVLVYLTYKSQSKELEEQRKQFKHSRIQDMSYSQRTLMLFLSEILKSLKEFFC